MHNLYEFLLSKNVNSIKSVGFAWSLRCLNKGTENLGDYSLDCTHEVNPSRRAGLTLSEKIPEEYMHKVWLGKRNTAVSEGSGDCHWCWLQQCAHQY